MRSAAGWRKSLADAGGARRSRWRRPGLFDLYLIRGVAGPFVLILAAVVVAMMLERTLRLIHELAAGGADISYLFALLGQLVPYYLDLAIPAAFMVALVLLIARLDDRLELEAMLASGLSLARIVAPLVGLGVLIGLAGLVASGWLEPLGRYAYRALRIEARNAGRIAQLQPGAIYHPADSLAVTFDRRDPDGGVAGIFVWQRLADGRMLVLTGSRGRIGFAPGDRLFGIDLDRGRYVAERPGAAGASAQLVEFRAIAFRESLRIDSANWPRGWDHNELTLPELRAAIRDGAPGIAPRALAAEYYSRLARAAILPLLPLLVLPLAFATKKGSRGLGILLCGVLLLAVHHSLNLARSLALDGALDPRLAILGAAGLCTALILLLFASGRRLPSHSPIHTVLKPIGRWRARIAPTPRAARGRRGRTLSNYVARRLGTWTLVALLGIVALLQMVDLLDRGEEFVERHMGLADVGRYALLRLAPTIQQALPIAALAGAMAAFAAIGRSRETTAIRAAGISQWRILGMALPVPLALALALFLLSEYAVPRSQLRFAAWWGERAPVRRDDPPPARWFRIGGEIVRAERASADGMRLAGLQIFRRDPDGLLAETVVARRADFGPQGWSLSEATATGFGPEGGWRTVDRLGWRTALDPPDVAAFFAAARPLSAADAQRSLDELAPVSQSATLFATRLHRSLAELLAPLLMLMLALPLAFVPPRRGAAWPALLYAGAGGLLYLVADGVLTVAAQVGALPPLVGAWAAPLIVALTGTTVLLYAER